MFEKWRLKRERKRIQAMCDHDWHVVRTFKADSGRYKYSYERVDYHDVYCPKCESTRYGISDGEMTRIEGKRKADRLYKLIQTT